jgi:hypothetical protein
MLVQDETPAAHLPVRVLFVVSESARASTNDLTNSLVELLNHRASFECVSIRDASTLLNSHPHAVVLCFNRHDDSAGLTDLLDGVEKRNIPILILTDDQSQRLVNKSHLLQNNQLPHSYDLDLDRFFE